MADYRLGFLGANGITGGGIPLATGVALAAKMRRNGKVVLCFFGDGATNQGAFHESLNMAAIWQLPVVYLCENNRYAMSTPIQYAAHVPDLASRAAGYGLPGQVVDGNDVLAVQTAVGEACRRARCGEGATLIECKTYRILGHSRGDPRRYRTVEEEAEWRAKDPILRFRAWLMQQTRLTPAQDRQIRRAAKDIVRQAVRFARTSPWPDAATLEAGVFA